LTTTPKELQMPKLPKYKTDPFYAYKYARRKRIILSEEHEKVFIKNSKIAIDYSLNLKFQRLFPETEKLIFKEYCDPNIKSLSPTNQRNYLDSFIRYIKQYNCCFSKSLEENFLENLHANTLVLYAAATDKRLDEKYEKKLLQDAFENKKFGSLVEYAHAIGCRLPEEMHNFILANYLNKKDELVFKSYFNYLKIIKKQLAKIAVFYGEKSTIKEVIDQL